MENREEIIEKNRNLYNQEQISFIAQNCIGGVIYHDMNKKFLSPTINLYFSASDFIKFVNNLEYYLSLDINITNNDPITAELDDIKLYFLHYNSEEEAIQKWEERKKRIIKDKIFVICTDRDGFDDECMEKFKNIKLPKALITCNEKWRNYPFVIYLEQYKNLTQVPDTIPTREFYNGTQLIKLINEV